MTRNTQKHKARLSNVRTRISKTRVKRMKEVFSLKIIEWYSNPIVKETISEYCQGRLIQLGSAPILRRYDGEHKPYFNPAPEDIVKWIKESQLTGVLASIATVTSYVDEQTIKSMRPNLDRVDLIFDLDCKASITLDQMKTFAEVIVESLKEIGLDKSCYLTNSRRTRNNLHVIVPGKAIKKFPRTNQDEVVRAIGNWCISRIYEIVKEKHPDLLPLLTATEKKDADVTISCFSDITRPFPVPLSLYWKPRYETETFICPFPPDQIKNYDPSWADVNTPNLAFKDCWKVKDEVELSDKIFHILLESRERKFIGAEAAGKWETPKDLDMDAIREAISNERYEEVFCPALTKAFTFPFSVGHRRPVLSLLLAELKGLGFPDEDIFEILWKRNQKFDEPHSRSHFEDFFTNEIKRYGTHFSPPGCEIINHGGGALFDGLQALNLCDLACPYQEEVSHPIWATVKMKSEYKPVRVLDIYSNVGAFVNRRIEVDLVPQAIIPGKTVPKKLKWKCEKCYRTEIQELRSPYERALALYHPPRNWCGCPRQYWHHSNLEVCSCYIISGIDPLEKVGGIGEAAVDRRPIYIYYPTDEPLKTFWGNLRVQGVLKRTPSKDKIAKTVIVADSIESIEEAQFAVTGKDLQKFAEHYSFKTREEVTEKLDKTIAPWIAGRPLVKVFVALAMHTPMFLPMPSGVKEIKYELGVGRIAFIGEERTGKGNIVNDILSLCPQPSELISGETAGRTGLVYMIQQTPEGDWEVVWRAIPRNDGGLIGLIAAHGLPKEEVSKLRETLATGFTKVDRAGVGQRLTRIRLIAEGNPWRLPVDNCGPSRYDALNFFVLTKNRPDRARWDFVFVFKREDVPPHIITEAQVERTGKMKVTRAIPSEVYRRKVKAAWTLQPEDIMFEGDVKNKMAELAADYQRRYHFSGLITNEFYKTLMKYTVALSLLVNSISVNESRLRVHINETHLEWMKEYIDDWLMDIQAHIAEKRETLDLTTLDDDYLFAFEPERRDVFTLIMQRGVIRNKTIVEKMGISSGRVSQIAAELEERKIIERTSKGYCLTRLGNKIAEKYLSSEKKETTKNDTKSEDVDKLGKWSEMCFPQKSLSG